MSESRKPVAHRLRDRLFRGSDAQFQAIAERLDHVHGIVIATQRRVDALEMRLPETESAVRRVDGVVAAYTLADVDALRAEQLALAFRLAAIEDLLSPSHSTGTAS